MKPTNISADRKLFYQTKIQANSCPDVQRKTDWCEACSDKPGWQGYRASPPLLYSTFRTRARADPVARFKRCYEAVQGNKVTIDITPNPIYNTGYWMVLKICVNPIVNWNRTLTFKPPDGIQIENTVLPTGKGCVETNIIIDQSITGEINIPYKINGLNATFYATIISSIVPFKPVMSFNPDTILQTWPDLCDASFELVFSPVPKFDLEIDIENTPQYTFTPSTFTVKPGQKEVPLKLELHKPFGDATTVFEVNISYKSIDNIVSYSGIQDVALKVYSLWNPLKTSMTILTDPIPTYDLSQYGFRTTTTCDGSYLFVGAFRAAYDSTELNERIGTLFVYKKNNENWNHIQTIFCPEPPETIVPPPPHQPTKVRNSFSLSIVMDEDANYVVVSAPCCNEFRNPFGAYTPSGNIGWIYTFKKGNDKWELMSDNIITNPTPTASIMPGIWQQNGFGARMCMTKDGKYLAVSNWTDSSTAQRIFVYKFINEQWVLTGGNPLGTKAEQALVNQEWSVQCGESLVFTDDGKYLLIGDHGTEGPTYPDANGSVYVAVNNNDSFDYHDTTCLTPGNYLKGFGYSISMAGNNVAIGAPSTHVGTMTLAGKTVLTVLNNGILSNDLFEIASPDPQEHGYFGRHVLLATDAEYLYIGQPIYTTSIEDNGTLFIFKENFGTNYSYYKTINSPNGPSYVAPPGDQFAEFFSITTDNKYLFISSPHLPIPKLYVYKSFND